MLGIILGITELALERTDLSGPVLADLTEIHDVAERSADLTRQLLAFARKQTIMPQALDLNETMTGMLNMLRRLIGENIDLRWHPGEKLWSVHMDPTQIDQILANLCTNARDAIENVGKVRRLMFTCQGIWGKPHCRRAKTPSKCPGAAMQPFSWLRMNRNF